MTDDREGAAGELAWLDDAAGTAGDVAVDLAAIWATVEMERALRELGLAPERARDAVDDPLLGARVLVVDGEPGELRLALAEPSTEGRLAAFLARHDEGPAGRYVGLALALETVAVRAAAGGVLVSRPETGPFGREVLVLGGGLGAPHVLLVEVAAVPSPP